MERQRSTNCTYCKRSRASATASAGGDRWLLPAKCATFFSTNSTHPTPACGKLGKQRLRSTSKKVRTALIGVTAYRTVWTVSELAEM